MKPAMKSRPIPRWLRWLPWRYLVRRMATGGGFVDPVKIFSRFESFAQPLEVKEPLELLRAGLVFQARGILNTSAIQHNLDWVWPHWVERQYDPRDPAFVPRAFSLTHVNLTHRSWTATGLPDCEQLPIVDPRGLVTPFWDGWSIDAWVVGRGGRMLLPSRCAGTSQQLRLTPGPEVVTHARDESFELESRVRVERDGDEICCVVGLTAQGSDDASLAVSLRPYNPEGVSFVDEIALLPNEPGWALENQLVRLSSAPSQTAFSDYRSGDVLHHLDHADDRRQIRCDVGMATAAALFPLPQEGSLSLEVRVPLEQESAAGATAAVSWSSALSGRAKLRVPDERIAELYEQSIATLVLHTPGDVYPGPYTYKRFWFRDATFILHALLCAGLHDRVRSALERFPARQHANGFFHSQDGEWDSNGEVLWLFDRYQQLTGETLDEPWLKAIRRGARWIQRRRVADGADLRHAGLMPAGFSAEHLGPNDFYYWDDFWSVAGLRAAARLLDEEPSSEHGFRAEAEALLGAVERSLEQTGESRPAMPASPYRRLDCGSIGSLAAGYPVQIWGGQDPRLLDTAGYLLENAFLDDAFFHDIIHSGINPYLTLHVAQVLLRAGDDRCVALMRAVANLASATGQWPEALHPRTGGGCMGDGQHSWAAAEWFLYLRNCFVREESDRLVLASGIPQEWLRAGSDLALGPTSTRFGAVEVEVQPGPREIRVTWRGDWHREAPRIEVAMFGHPAVEARGDEGAVSIERKGSS